MTTTERPKMVSRPTEAEVRAEPAGRRLDAWVHCIVLGGNWKDCVYTLNDGEGERFSLGPDSPSCHSDDWAYAGPLLESIKEYWVIDQNGEVEVGDNPWKSKIVTFDPKKPNDLCRAICVAIILEKLMEQPANVLDQE